ncbi:PREDICTED: sperm-associated antigen 1 [Bactrocera latifrons]|uniref:sperm-associated antigen 1 n=1 Tax=Bactrocera latifrons TaxID=174628 RepID=UPI0008DE56D2|nr:PREDICTED: sperm-associated antigen 1 [Bactrocera latifrons]
MDGKETKRKLIDKYEIPINHLDFAYIAECENAREMEKIVQILRSGEEGYFPDLTNCAENKLRELKPNSRLFRYEEKLQGRETLSKQEWKPIFDWTHNIKVKDVELSAAAEKMAKLDLGVPPVRKSGVIKQCDENNEHKSKQNGGLAATTSKISTERIKSTDYGKWDKYDADEECLRMELAEERVQEEVERKNRLNKQKSKLQVEHDNNKVTAAETVKEQDVLSKFTDVECERLAEEYRLRGNDYFRAKEYENAIKEYGRAISVCAEKAAPAYNNRAAANIKLKWYTEAIKDCEQCLQLEPNNLKARLRLADATYANGERQESYALYMQVLELEPDNVNALKATAQLKSLYGDFPPANATRLHIEEKSAKTEKKREKKIAKKETKTKTFGKQTLENTKTVETIPPKTKPADYDLADLIKPNRLVKKKLATAAAALSNMKTPKQARQQPTKTTETTVPTTYPNELRLPSDTPKAGGKILIQEI